jgi:hypothetical protein
MSHPRRIELAISEWTADLTVTRNASTNPPLMLSAAGGFVDFDMVESVHESIIAIPAGQR